MLQTALIIYVVSIPIAYLLSKVLYSRHHEYLNDNVGTPWDAMLLLTVASFLPVMNTILIGYIIHFIIKEMTYKDDEGEEGVSVDDLKP